MKIFKKFNSLDTRESNWQVMWEECLALKTLIDVCPSGISILHLAFPQQRIPITVLPGQQLVFSQLGRKFLIPLPQPLWYEHYGHVPPHPTGVRSFIEVITIGVQWDIISIFDCNFLIKHSLFINFFAIYFSEVPFSVFLHFESWFVFFLLSFERCFYILDIDLYQLHISNFFLFTCFIL